MRKASGLLVVHVGNDPGGDRASGIASVIRGYLSWEWPRSRHRAIASFRQGNSPVPALGLVLAAACRIVVLPRTAVINVHLSQRGSFLREGALLMLARLSRRRTSVTLHGSEFEAFCRARPRLVRLVIGAADDVIVLHDRARRAVLRLLPEARVHVLPNAIRVPAAPPFSAEGNDVVFAGAVGYRKGVDTLLEAWACLTDSTRRSRRLVIAGPVVDEAVVKSLPEDVVLLGSVPPERVGELLSTCALAVLPSRAEAFPMFLLEALAQGRAVIGTDVGGVPALVGHSGIVVPPGDVPALAEALEIMLGSEDQRLRCAATARAHVEQHFTPEVLAPKMEIVWGTRS